MARILIVDDDPAIRTLLDDILEAEGYEVLHAADGQAAVDIARSRNPHLILMDLMMPVLDGPSAVRILKADSRTKKIRIIVMSAVMNLRRNWRDLPADGILAKPFDLDALLDNVATQVVGAE